MESRVPEWLGSDKGLLFSFQKPPFHHVLTCLFFNVFIWGGEEGESLFYKDTNFIMEVPMTSSKPNYFPKVPLPNIITPRVGEIRASTKEFWEDMNFRSIT